MVRRALLAALPCLLLFVAPAHAAPSADFFGTNVQPMLKLQLVAPDRWGLFTTRQASDGLKVARTDAIWRNAEPNPPQNGVHSYTWNAPGTGAEGQASIDTTVAALAAAGIRMSAVISTAPSWAGGGGRQVTPDHFPDLAAFASAFAARYGSNGSFWNEHPEIPRLPVQDYEIWTEANSSNSWSGGADAADYVAGLKQIAPAIHAADPKGQVLASIGWVGFQDFVDALYANGIKGVVDGIGFHPYAPRAIDIIDLVRKLRAKLASNGDGSLPIYVTETGQPRAASGAGSAHAGDGFVSDAARASTLSLTGEALAHGDCGVQDYLVYANVGSETSLEANNEGYMGMYSAADATPNALGTAIAGASQRWRAAQSTGIVLCGSGTTPAAAQLPLRLDLTHTTGTCVTGHVTYRANPIEGATLALRPTTGATATNVSDAFGATKTCVASGAASFDVDAEIPNVALSARYRCSTGNANACTIVAAAPDGSTGTSAGANGTLTASAICKSLISARILRVTRRSAKLRAALTCGRTKPPRTTVTVFLKRKKAKKQSFVRRVRLAAGKSLTFSVQRRLRPGDRLVLVRVANAATRATRIQRTATATRAVGAR